MGRMITEETHQDLIKTWYETATGKEMNLEKLPGFIKSITEDYEHDYGTICHAIAASAIAAAKAADRSPSGGITGFQAGAVFWEFYEHWIGEPGPKRMTEYKNMLYPQCEKKFNTVTPSTWEWLQEMAKGSLAMEPTASDTIKEHWQSIIDGKVPFGYSVKED